MPTRSSSSEGPPTPSRAPRTPENRAPQTHQGLWRDISLASIGALLLSLPVFASIAGAFTASWGPGDLLSTYNNVNNWGGFAYRISEHNGFPGNMNLNLFPGVDITQNTFAALLGLGSDSPFLGLNLLIFLSFPLTAALAVIAIRLVGLSGRWAIALSLAFTFTPYHWGRALGHAYLSTSYAAVTAVILALLIGLGYIEGKHRARFWIAVAALILVTAWSGIYYAAFGVLLLATATLWRYFQGAHWRALLRNLALLAALALTTILGLLPSLMNRLNEPVAGLGDRPPSESVDLAGSLAMLVVPAPVSVLPYMGYYNEAVSSITDGQPFSEAIAITNFGTWTLTVSLLLALVWIGIQIRQRKPLPVQIKLVAFLASITVLFFIPWGANILVAHFLTAQIRAWNRLVPTLELLIVLLAAAAIAHSALLQRRKVAIPASLLILAVVLLDQVIPYRALYQETADRYALDSQFAEEYAKSVNAAIPQYCGVVQLPAMVYPENGQVPPSLNDYEHFWQSLTNSEKAWTYGAVRGTPSSEEAEALAEAAESGNIRALQAANVCAIHLDLRGYEDPTQMITSLTAAFGEPITTGRDGDWLLFEVKSS